MMHNQNTAASPTKRSPPCDDEAGVAGGRQAVEYLGKSDGKWLGVPVACINEAVSPRWLLHARRRLQVAQNTKSLKRISAFRS
jgi:hypothetical protein